MPPIGRADIATESFRKSSCGRRAELLTERLGVFKPRLKVEWRRFYNKCRMESIAIHRGNCVSSQIVDEAQVVLALWANVDMPASMILQVQPGHRMQQGVRTPNSEQHTRVSSCCLRPEDSDFEQFAAHSRDLLAHGSGGR